VAGNCELYNELSVSITGKFFEYRNDSQPSLETVVFCALQVKLLVGNAMKQYKYYSEAIIQKNVLFCNANKCYRYQIAHGYQ
jgi:hypothetical protein